MIKNALGVKVDFDPLSGVDNEQAETVRAAAKIDEMIHVNNPQDEAIENALMSVINDGEDDVGDSDSSPVTDKVLFKDPGDGSDLPDEEGIDLIKDFGDGSDLSEENLGGESTQYGGNHQSQSQAMDELNSLVGLDEAKTQIKSLVNLLQVRKRCAELGIKRPAATLHINVIQFRTFEGVPSLNSRLVKAF